MEKTLLYAPAPAKINLYLKVTGKRSNGYHELESLFLPLNNIADDIAIDCDALPGAITVGCSDVMLPGGTKNIVMLAASIATSITMFFFKKPVAFRVICTYCKEFIFFLFFPPGL